VNTETPEEERMNEGRPARAEKAIRSGKTDLTNQTAETRRTENKMKKQQKTTGTGSLGETPPCLEIPQTKRHKRSAMERAPFSQ
jgi:hypothetical protein